MDGFNGINNEINTLLSCILLVQVFDRTLLRDIKCKETGLTLLEVVSFLVL